MRKHRNRISAEVPSDNGSRASGPSRTLTEKAYHCLKEAIVRCELEEGVFLSEREITERFHIGRTPFREACNRLHHEHLLEVVAHRGYLVPRMSLQEVRDLFEIRVLVEGSLAELAAVRATTAEADELDRLANRGIAAGSQNNSRAEVNVDFHLHLATLAHNGELLRLERGVLERTRRLDYSVARSIGVQRQDMNLQRLHQPIVDAIRKHDRTGARRAVVHDIQQAQKILLGISNVVMEAPAETPVE
jgi:DNA-binding GntR family transcriptional regulator